MKQKRIGMSAAYLNVGSGLIMILGGTEEYNVRVGPGPLSIVFKG